MKKNHFLLIELSLFDEKKIDFQNFFAVFIFKFNNN